MVELCILENVSTQFLLQGEDGTPSLLRLRLATPGSDQGSQSRRR